MAQSDFGNIDVATTSGTDLANILESFRDALHSNHSGGTRPTYVVPGMFWINTGTTPWQLNFFDGTNDLLWATLNISSGQIRLYHEGNLLADVATSGSYNDLVDLPTVNGVSVSPDDTTPSDLEAKLLVAAGLALSTQNPGANETRTIGLDLADQAEAEGGSENTKPMTALRTAQAIDARGVPVGTVIDFAGTSAPTGWLVCDGASVDSGVYVDLFAAIGTTWGGTGAPFFNIPDLRRRATIGAGGAQVSGPDVNVGDVGGSETHTLTKNQMPAHNHAGTHTNTEAFTNVSTGSGGNNFLGSNSSNTVSNWTTTPPSEGGNQPHNNMQPSAVMNKIIKY